MVTIEVTGIQIKRPWPLKRRYYDRWRRLAKTSSRILLVQKLFLWETIFISDGEISTLPNIRVFT